MCRLYYSSQKGYSEKRPTKILDHKEYPNLGMYCLLLWHDVGYNDQDIEDWHPADFARSFEGLVENYRKLSEP